MSLTSSLLIGRSALTASQLAVQVTGDNLANAATPGYHRRVANLAAVRGNIDSRGIYTGRGVQVQSVRRAIDEALEGRLRANSSSLEATLVNEEVLTQIESLTNELGGQGVGNDLEALFNAFSELANNPGASENRALIVEQGVAVAGRLRRLRTDHIELRGALESELRQTVTRANELLNEIATLNSELVASEQGRSEDAALRDQRDVVLGELAQLVDINVVEQASGSVDVHVGSQPIVLGDQNRGLEVRDRVVNGESVAEVRIITSDERITPTGGRIGGLLAQRDGVVQGTIDDIDELTSGLIYEVNRIHSSGRSFPGLTDTIGYLRVAPADQAVSFNDPANTTFAGLAHGPTNGSFTVYVTDSSTGLVTQTEVFVDLDGVDNTGAAGFGDDTTLASLTADLGAIGSVNATITAAGELRLIADAGFEIGFADDTSGALAALGINTFFEGVDGRDIGVRGEIEKNPELIVAGLEPGSNEAALGIAELRDQGVDAFGGVSVLERWRQTTESVAVKTRSAQTATRASQQVQRSLEAQSAAISGVSVDEESINLLNFQRQYQAAAQFISTVDQMTQILLGLV